MHTMTTHHTLTATKCENATQMDGDIMKLKTQNRFRGFFATKFFGRKFVYIIKIWLKCQLATGFEHSNIEPFYDFLKMMNLVT